eukprot:scaffold91487_cov30-Tisochrysis_lutea.AAC.4
MREAARGAVRARRAMRTRWPLGLLASLPAASLAHAPPQLRTKSASEGRGGRHPAPLGCSSGAAVTDPDIHRSDIPTTTVGCEF